MNASSHGHVYAIMRDVVGLLDSGKLNITDLTQTRLSRNDLAAIVNEYYDSDIFQAIGDVVESEPEPEPQPESKPEPEPIAITVLEEVVTEDVSHE